MNESERLLRLLSGYLSRFAADISAEMVGELVAACGIGQEEAFALLLAGRLGLDAAGTDRAFYARYLRPCLRLLDAEVYRADAYYRAVCVPNLKRGGWELKQAAYRPFETFVCGDYRETADGRVLPQIGFFAERFEYPAALENGREWMTVTPNEIETMRAPLARAQGRVIAFGLGLGYFAFMAEQKDAVETVTVVERERAIIELFEQRLLPQFPRREKIRVVQADAFEYARALRGGEYDFAFADLWHDVADGLPMYREMRGILQPKQGMETAYWIEETMKWYE